MGVSTMYLVRFEFGKNEEEEVYFFKELEDSSLPPGSGGLYRVEGTKNRLIRSLRLREQAEEFIRLMGGIVIEQIEV